MTSKQLFISLLFLSSSVPSMYGIIPPPINPDGRRGDDLTDFYILLNEWERQRLEGSAEEASLSPSPQQPSSISSSANSSASAEQRDDRYNEDNNNTNLVFPHEDWELAPNERPIYDAPKSPSKEESDHNKSNELELYPTWGLESDELPLPVDVPVSSKESVKDDERLLQAEIDEAAKKARAKETNSSQPSSKDAETQTDEALANSLQVKSSPIPNSCLRKVILCAAGGTFLAGTVGFIVFRVARSYWQRDQINKVLRKYGKDLATISSNQSKVIIAAYNNDHRTVHAWLNLHGKNVVQHDRWIIAAISDFYFRKELSKDSAQAH